MAEFEKEEFKFPDEQETKGKPESELSVKMGTDEVADPIEVEVEDDTPPEDRNRQPLPEEMKEELEKDELDTYDEEVKSKLKQMKKVWHDERRAKEEAFREQQEAVRLAQKLLEENKRIKNILDTGGKEYAAILQNAANLEMEIAKRAYKEAYEAGESDKIVEAQQALQLANYKMLQAQNFKVPSLQERDFAVQERQEPAQPAVSAADPKLTAWQKRNPWYGSPRYKGMTAYALGVHDELAEDGVALGSDEYYASLDKTMRKRFPEYFLQTEESEEVEDSKAKAEPVRTKPSTVVAPAVRSTSSNKVKLNKSQMNLSKKLGITPEQYAIELKRLEAQNG
jgi:hypothetical protein